MEETVMEEKSFRTTLSVQAETLLMLDEKMQKCRAMAETLCSQLGLITQEYFILNEAMRMTIKEMNGGQLPPPTTTMRFPALNSYDIHP
jgi:hypothetical protein